MMRASGDEVNAVPAVSVSHGSPMVAPDPEGDYARALGAFASMVRPRAIVVVSAHREAPAPPRITARESPRSPIGGEASITGRGRRSPGGIRCVPH